jgi:hypothetical protein
MLSTLGPDAWLAPSSFGGVVTTGSGACLAAKSGSKYLLYGVLCVPNAPGATLDVIQFKINGGASGTDFIRCNIVGDANEVRFMFRVPILVDDVYMTKVSGTASLYAGVFAKEILV